MLTAIRAASRRLRSHPTASVAAVAALALGIGTGVAAWAVLSTLLLNPLHVAKPDELVVVASRSALGASAGGGTSDETHFYPVYANLRATDVFADVGAYGRESLLVEIAGSSAVRRVYFVSSNLFRTLGLKPQTGRWFSSAEDQPGAAPVAIVSNRFWKSAFAPDQTPLGTEIIVAGKKTPIVGIAPSTFPGLDLTDPPDVFLPLETVTDVVGPGRIFLGEPSGTVSSWTRIVARLRPERSNEQTLTALQALRMTGLRNGQSFELLPISTASVPERVRPAMRMFAQLLATTVGLLFATACLSVAMLLFVRLEGSRNELIVRLALGASRTWVAERLLSEALWLASTGALAAIPVCALLLKLIGSLELPGNVSLGELDLAIGPPLLLTAIVGAVCALALIVCVGLLAVGISRSVNRLTLSTTATAVSSRGRSVLVVAQVAIAMALLCGAGVFVRSLRTALDLNTGRDSEYVATAQLQMWRLNYDANRAQTFVMDVRERLKANPLFDNVSISLVDASGLSANSNVDLGGQTIRLPSYLSLNRVDGSYFKTLNISLLSGRDFADSDTPHAPLVAIISESLARSLGVGGELVGRQLALEGHADLKYTIVGVVPDVVNTLRYSQPLALYTPLSQWDDSVATRNIIFRSRHVAIAEQAAMSAILELDKEMPTTAFVTMRERLGREMNPQRFAAAVLGVLGSVAGVITALGVYALSLSLAKAREQEIGIRAALGATRAQLTALLLVGTLRLVGLGVALGTILVWSESSFLRSLLFGVRATDPLTLALVSVLVLGIAGVVGAWPAIRSYQAGLVQLIRG